MNTEKNKKIELGQEMAAQRESKGLTVKQLSDITKISVVNIENIEKGVLDFLPSAYVKAYLSALSQELGLDPTVILKKYHESFFKPVEGEEKPELPVETPAPAPVVREAPKPEKRPEEPVKQEEKAEKPVPVKEDKPAPVIDDKPKPEPKAEKPVSKPMYKDKPAVPEKKPEPAPIKPQPVMPKSNWFEDLKLMLGFYSVFIYAFLFVAVLIVVFIFVVPKLRAPKNASEQPVFVAQPDTPATAVNADTSIVPEAPPLTALMLKMTVSDSTWLRIVYNGGFVEEAIFAPGEEKTWQSDSLFWMRIGNATGIKLYLNERDLGPVGKAGQITNIKIDKGGVHNVYKYEFPKEMGIEG